MSQDLKLQQLLLETFKAELQESHQALITTLLTLENIHTEEELKNTLKTLFRYSHNIKGAAASASIPTISTMAHQLEDLFQKWGNTTHFPTKQEIDNCLNVVDNFLAAFKSHEQGAAHIHEETTARPDMDEFIQMPLNRIEKANAKANELIIFKLKLNNWFKSVEQVSKVIEEQNEVKKLHAIINESGQFLGEFSRAIQYLQDELHEMRMVPAGILITPLVRAVRDLSTHLNKSVELQVIGGDIELDKTILDAIKDPLQHLIRNAIAHGIELPEEREKLNKPNPAKLLLDISQVSGKIIMKITDDGRGIDLEKLKTAAIKQGLYAEKDRNTISDEQWLNCIFKSGFSLQKEITEISGRGVGLDAVLHNINKVKGTIRVDTKLHQGTTFMLSLPLTLATTRGIFFKINDQIMMIPTLSVKALYVLDPGKIVWINNQATFLLRKKPIPLISLNYVLNNTYEEPLPHNVYYGILIETETDTMMFWVDNILNEQDSVVKSLPPPFNSLNLYIGVTLNEDSDLVLVIDAKKLLAQAKKQPILSHMPTVKNEIPAKPKQVLIVDDSLTTRTLCANALEASGYKTITAVDGKKAWDLLQKTEIDCVITDVVMPEIDGFELTKLIKNSQDLSHIPVIIVSILKSKKEQKKGLDAGADAYLTKSEFDTHSLIETVEALL